MRLEPFLKNGRVLFRKNRHVATYTAQRLAHAERVSGYLVAKPVVVKGDEEFAFCVVAAPDHLDLKRAADALHESTVRLASEKEMAKLFPDCELGAEPPVGALFGMRTVMDVRLRDEEYLVMQSGKHTESVRLKRADWERICEPVVAPIVLE